MKIYWIKAQAPRRVLALAKHLGFAADFIEIDLMAGGLKTPDFASLNPNKKAPVLVDGDQVLWESSAIMTYLCIKAGSDMWPTRNAAEQVEILRWLSWNDSHWAPAVGPFYFEHVVKSTFGLGPPDRESLKPRVPELQRFAAVGWSFGGPQFRRVRTADDCRLPGGLDGDLLARIGNASRWLSQHRPLDRRPVAHSSLGAAMARGSRGPGIGGELTTNRSSTFATNHWSTL